MPRKHHSTVLGLFLLTNTLWAQDSAPKADKPPAIKPLQVLSGHDAEVYCIRYSPDGTKLVTASFDKTIRLWDAASGKELASFAGHQGKVLTVAFSGDGRSLLSGSEDKTVKLWDVPGDGAAPFAGHGGPVLSLAASADGNWLATGSADGTARIWQRASRKEALKMEAGCPVRAVAFSTDGKRLATGGEDKKLRLWDISSVTAPTPAAATAVDLVKQGTPWRYHKGSSEPPAEWKQVGFDDGQWAAGPGGFGYSGSADELATVGTKLDDMMGNYVSIYTRTRFKIDDPKMVERLALRVLVDDAMVAYLNGVEVGRDNIDGTPPRHDGVAKTSHEALAVDIDLTPHLDKLVAGDNVLAVQGHNHELPSSDLVLTATLNVTFQQAKKEEAPPKLDLAQVECGAPVTAVAWSADGALVAAGADKTIVVHTLADSSVKKLDQGGAVLALAFLAGPQLAAAGEGGAIKVWNVAEAKVQGTLEGHQGAVLSLAVRPDRSQLLSGGEDKTVRLWDAAQGKELKSFAGHQGKVTAVAFAGEPKSVISGGDEGAVRTWNVESGAPVRTFSQGAAVAGVAATADGRFYGAGGGNDALEHRVVSTEAVRTMSGHGGLVHAVAFSPDASLVASGSQDKTVILWSRGDGKEVRKINAHDSSVYVLAFNGDGSLLASAGLDRAVKLWKTADGSLVKKLDGHGEGVFCLKFSADGQSLYSGSSDRTIRKWNVADGAQVAMLEGHQGWVCGLALFPGEDRMVSVDYGGYLHTWNLADGKQLGRRRAPTVIYDLALSPDGKQLAVAALSGKALILEAE